jgi:hypothetical protein
MHIIKNFDYWYVILALKLTKIDCRWHDFIKMLLKFMDSTNEIL